MDIIQGMFMKQCTPSFHQFTLFAYLVRKVHVGDVIVQALFRLSSVHRPSISFKLFSKPAWLFKATFHEEPPCLYKWSWAHDKMAATLNCGKLLDQSQNNRIYDGAMAETKKLQATFQITWFDLTRGYAKYEYK